MVIKAKVPNVVIAMHMRSTDYSARLTPQQCDDLLEVIPQLGSINKKVDVVWNHVFDKSEGSGINKQEDTPESGETKLHLEGGSNVENQSRTPTFTSFQGSRSMP